MKTKADKFSNPIIILFFFLSTLNQALAISQFDEDNNCPTPSETQKMSEPPFFLSDFTELKQLRQEQKIKYFSELEKLTGKNKNIDVPTQDNLVKMSKNECPWEQLRL